MSLFNSKSSDLPQSSTCFSASHRNLLLLLTSKLTQTPRRRCPNLKKTFLVASSLIFLLSICLTASAERLPRQGDDEAQGQAEEDWLRSEKDVRMLEKIISNLYGQENPFNLLAKRSGVSGGGKHHNSARPEKRFAKQHASQMYKETPDFGLIRQHEGKKTLLRKIN